MSKSARFVIVSRDPVFCLGVKRGLTDFPSVEMVVNVASQAEAENKIARVTSTILLMDLDTITIDPYLMKRMVARFNNVLVVLTAAKESIARRLMSATVRDFAQKPLQFNNANINRYLRLILDRMKGVASSGQAEVSYKDVGKTVGINDKIIAVASSTGGVEAFEKVVSLLPKDVPPLLLVQHMPSGFTKFFADRLNNMYPQVIKEAKHGDFLMQGQILIAPAGNHMQLVKKQDKLAVDCFMGSKMHGVIPAADILFESIANIQRRNAVGVILTGMGADGGRGLMLMHNAGAKTIIQDEETCVVFGMPKVAKDLGAVDFELPINKIAGKIMALV